MRVLKLENETGHKVRRLLTRAVGAVAATAITLSPLAAPAAAHAVRLPSDAVAGVAAAKLPASAAPSIDAAAGILVTGDGRVLWARNADTSRAMASTTKMMTALLAIENGRLDRTVIVSSAAASTGDGIGLRAGQRITVRQLLELALVASSNDAAYALGESVSGNMPAFVAKMNARAASLGLKRTHYANPHGLDAPGHYSSASDLAVLARKLMSFREARAAVSHRSVVAPGIGVLPSTDKLLGSYRGLMGVKTGFTGDAGFCYVGAATRGGTSLYAVVLGTSSNDARFAQAARLMDWGFGNFAARAVATKGQAVGTTTVADGRSKVALRLGGSASAQVFRPAGPVTRQLSVPARVPLPVFAGERLGEARFVQSGRVVARVPVVASQSVAAVDETVGVVPVADYLDRTVAARTALATSSVPAFDQRVRVARRIALDPQVTAPVAAGQRLGEIVYTHGSRVILRVPVVAAESVGQPDTLERFGISLLRQWRSVTGEPVMASLQVVAR